MKKTLFILLFFFIHSIYSQNKTVITWKGSPISVENLLQKYIQIPSVSGSEKKAGDFIKAVCKENGLFIADFGSDNGNYNFAASIFPLSSKKPNIVFLNHIDVIPENEESVNGAYSGKIIDQHVYGRGAIDNKGAALMQLYSMLQLVQNANLENSEYNVTFLAVSCEETQCDGGVAYVIDNYLKVLNPAVVIGEGPSEITSLIKGSFKNPIFGVSIAHKRTFWLHLELENHTNGHGSITPLKYANKELIVSLNRLTKKKNKAIFNDLNVNFLKGLAPHKNGAEKLLLKHPRRFKLILMPQLRKKPELFALFSNTITLTNIYTNSNSFNKIPTKAGAYLDCRLLPSTDEKAFLELIKKRLKNDSIKITIVDNMPQTEPSTLNNIFYTQFKKAILQKYTNAEVLPLLLPNTNDLGAFRAKGILAYATVPVHFTREEVEAIHNNNERIPIQALYDGAEVYFSFLTKMVQK